MQVLSLNGALVILAAAAQSGAVITALFIAAVLNIAFLFRLARGAGIMSPSGFESAMRGLDETGRMLGGWRKAVAASIEARGGRRGSRA